MIKTIVLLGLAAIALAQFPAFGGSGSFGAQTSVFFTSITATSTATTAGPTTATGFNAGLSGFANLGLNFQFFLTSSTGTGTVVINGTQFTGGSFTSATGLSNTGAAGGTGGAGVTSNFGFTYNSTIAPGAYNLTLVITPSLAVTPVSPNIQLFYAASASDGSNQAYSSGASGTNFVGALPSNITYNGNTVSSISFQLPPVSNGVVSAANVNLAAGTSFATPAVFPVLLGTTAQVAAKAYALYVFSSNFALTLYNSAATSITASSQTSISSNTGLTAGASTSVATGNTVSGVTYNSSNTIYTGVSFNVTVQNQADTASTLIYNTSSLAIASGRRAFWGFYNQTANVVQILTDSVYNSASATVTVNVTHYSSYGVYTSNATSSSSNATSSSSNGGTTSSSTTGNPGDSNMLVASAFLVMAAIALIM